MECSRTVYAPKALSLRKYRRKNDIDFRNQVREKERQSRLEDPFIHIFRCIKARAKSKQIPFDLDIEYVKSIWTGVCPIFDTPLTLGAGMGRRDTSHFNRVSIASLDRIDPTKGYTKGNVCWISLLGNTMKNDSSSNELVQFAKWVLKTYPK